VQHKKHSCSLGQTKEWAQDNRATSNNQESKESSIKHTVRLNVGTKPKFTSVRCLIAVSCRSDGSAGTHAARPSMTKSQNHSCLPVHISSSHCTLPCTLRPLQPFLLSHRSNFLCSLPKNNTAGELEKLLMQDYERGEGKGCFCRVESSTRPRPCHIFCDRDTTCPNFVSGGKRVHPACFACLILFKDYSLAPMETLRCGTPLERFSRSCREMDKKTSHDSIS